MFTRQQIVAAFLQESGLADPYGTVANLHTAVNTSDNGEALTEEESDELDLLEHVADMDH